MLSICALCSGMVVSVSVDFQRCDGRSVLSARFKIKSD